MTAEHLVATLLARGATIRLDETTGELVVRPARAVTLELAAFIRERRDEVVEVVRRMQARERARGGPSRFSFRCVVCDTRFDEDDVTPGSWLPTPDGGWWPRCPTCVAVGRTPTPGTSRPSGPPHRGRRP